MSTLPKRNLIAVAFSDLHLSLTAPVCRADKDWMAVQAHYLAQVKEIAGNASILFAGDLFDRWNAPPELIYFALKHLPDGMICIPGQHDLPNHSIEDMHRSGYGVLVEAGKIKDISGGITTAKVNWLCEEAHVCGFGWSENISTAPKKYGTEILIALIHRYCWADKVHAYPDAPETAHISAFKQSLKGYDVAVFGDNHNEWIAGCGKCTVANTGTLIRRKSDEIRNLPRISKIFSDGTVQLVPLDCGIDKFHPNAKEREQSEVPVDMKRFIEELEGLGEHGLNFREVVKRHLESGDVGAGAAKIIRESLEAI